MLGYMCMLYVLYLPSFVIFTNNITLSSPSTGWPTQTLSDISENFSTTKCTDHHTASAIIGSPMSYSSVVPNRTPLGFSVPSLCTTICEELINRITVHVISFDYKPQQEPDSTKHNGCIIHTIYGVGTTEKNCHTCILNRRVGNYSHL